MTNREHDSNRSVAAAAVALLGILTASAGVSDAAGVTSTLVQNGKSLKVIGSNQANDVEVRIDDLLNVVRVYDGAVLLGSYQSSPIKKIQVALNGGDDDLEFGLAPGSSHKFEKTVDIKLGAGNDTSFVEFRGGGGSSIVQGTLEVAVSGGSGDDEVYAHFARKHGGKLEFGCKMGGGNDTCAGMMWGDVTGGADVEFDLRGDAGDDSVWSWNTYDQFEGSYSSIDVAGDATLKIRMDGGPGIDQLTPTYSGEMDGDFTLLANGTGDADLANGLVVLQPTSSGEVDAILWGSSGDDDLTLEVNDNSGASPSIAAAIDGGAGTDLCQSTPNVSKIGCP